MFRSAVVSSLKIVHTILLMDLRKFKLTRICAKYKSLFTIKILNFAQTVNSLRFLDHDSKAVYDSQKAHYTTFYSFEMIFRVNMG